jgi:phage shock protein C
MTYGPDPGTPPADQNSGRPLPVPPPPVPPPPPAVRPPLRRSTTDKMAGGVCGGLAEHTGVDSLLWRVGFVAFTLAGGAGVLVYLLLWVLMPPGPRAADQQPGQLDRLAEQLHEKVYSTGWMPPRQ